MKLSEELTWRGFAGQTTLKQPQDINNHTTFYWGVDPSSDSMTVGNLATAMMIHTFMRHGYKGVLLVGGSTGLIGDPDGKANERDLKTAERVSANADKITAQYHTIFKDMDFTIVNNYDWMQSVSYLTFLRDIGKHFSMTQLLDREFVKTRIGGEASGISYAEFSYSLLQAYDFWHLYRTAGVRLQLCGADQWGNSLAGVELIRKKENQQVHLWSGPLLINKQTGVKFGKSESGAIWLDETKTSPYQFYQFWLQTADDDVEDYLKRFTLLQKATIDDIMYDFRAHKAARSAQKKLAREVTAFVHGSSKAGDVERVTAVLFGDSTLGDLNQVHIDALKREIPHTASSSVVEAMVTTGLAGSAGEARRLLKSGGVSVDGVKIYEDQPLAHRPRLIKKGKNSFALVLPHQ